MANIMNEQNNSSGNSIPDETNSSNGRDSSPQQASSSNPQERLKRLKELEAILASSKSRNDFEQTFLALAIIYTEEYWKDHDNGYNSFKEYVLKERHCCDSHFYRLQEACECWKNSPVGERPKTEREARRWKEERQAKNKKKTCTKDEQEKDEHSPMGENDESMPKPNDEVDEVAQGQDLVDNLLVLFNNSDDKLALYPELQRVENTAKEFRKLQQSQNLKKAA
jgi:hypothetical protein